MVYMSCQDGLVGSSLKEQYSVGISYTCYYLLIVVILVHYTVYLLIMLSIETFLNKYYSFEKHCLTLIEINVFQLFG